MFIVFILAPSGHTVYINYFVILVYSDAFMAEVIEPINDCTRSNIIFFCLNQDHIYNLWEACLIVRSI